MVLPISSKSSILFEIEDPRFCIQIENLDKIGTRRSKMFFVYILKSQRNGMYYIGQTNNIDERLAGHNRGKDHSSKIGMPWTLIYSEKYNTRKEVITRERFIKNKKSRKFIEDLIAAG